jgi:hypothetical protein
MTEKPLELFVATRFQQPSFRVGSNRGGLRSPRLRYG